MRRRVFAPLLLVALPCAARAQDEGEVMRSLGARLGPSLVRVQVRTHLRIERLPGVAPSARRTHQVSLAGIVVSKDGLVAFPARALDPAAASFALLGTRVRAEIGRVQVVGSDGRIRQAEWVGRDAKRGFAFARVAAAGRKGLKPVAFSDRSVKQGERLFVLSLTAKRLGHTPRVELVRVSFATKPVAGITPQLPHALGGLVVAGGKAVGVLSHYVPLPKQGLLRPDLLALAQAGFVIPARVLTPLIQKPPREARVGIKLRARAWLGIRHQVLTTELAQRLGLDVDVGVRVARLFEGPGKVAGLKVGDILLKLEGEPLDLDPDESFDDLIEDYGVGAKVAFLVRRGGKNQTIKVQLARGPTRPQEAESLRLAALGISLRALTFYDRVEAGLEAKTQGAVVMRLEADGSGSRAGLRVGDLILGVDGSPVQGLQDLRQLLLKAGVHPLKVRRRGKDLTLRVRR